MSSKILRGGEGVGVPLLRWSPAGTLDPAAAGETPAPAADRARLTAEMEEQIAGRLREAYQSGYREGQNAGRTQAAAEQQPVFERMGRAIQEIAGLRPRLMREAQGQLVELSLGIARRILHRELTVDPGALEGLVRAVLEKLAGQEICRIRVHPQLEAGVRQALAAQARDGLAVIADLTLERGALLVETGRGKLDASAETQLAEIGRGLADRVAAR